MKGKINALLLSLCIVLLMVATIVGTVAYLTDTEEVVNTFTVGKVNITLDEADVDENGKVIEGNHRVKENRYHLVPGRKYVKDPTITVVKGSEKSYVRMLVTINEASDLKAVFGDNFLPQNYAQGWDSEVWNCVSTTVNNDDTVTYEFRYHTTVDASDSDKDIVLQPLFTSIAVPGELDGAELEAIKDLKITVIGNAIQETGFKTVDDAWVAFEAQINK